MQDNMLLLKFQNIYIYLVNKYVTYQNESLTIVSFVLKVTPIVRPIPRWRPSYPLMASALSLDGANYIVKCKFS